MSGLWRLSGNPGFEATTSTSLLEGMVPVRGSRARTMPAEASGSRPFANEEWPCHMEVGASRRYWLAIVLASWAACAAAQADEVSPAPSAKAGDRLNAQAAGAETKPAPAETPVRKSRFRRLLDRSLLRV